MTHSQLAFLSEPLSRTRLPINPAPLSHVRRRTGADKHTAHVYPPFPAVSGGLLSLRRLQRPPPRADVASMSGSARLAESGERRRRTVVPPAPEVVASARAAGLRYVNAANIAGLGRRRKIGRASCRERVESW